jgi:hypothetical protein
MYLGDSGTGKTGSLVSLVQAGYKLRILDLDNGLDILKAFIERDCPDKLESVDYETRRDKYKAGPSGPILAGVAKAFSQCMSLMNKWSDDSVPETWGSEYILVIDSLTGLGNAALDWQKGMFPGVKDQRQWYRGAQEAVDNFLGLITSEAFNTNVVVIAHVKFQEDANGMMRGYPNSVGSAYNPFIASRFNNMVLARSEGTGTTVKRTIWTIPTSQIDLKSSAPFKVENKLPLETGLATLFEQLKGQMK